MKKLLIFLSALVMSVSCSDFLDQPVHGSENLDQYFNNTKEAEAFVTGCYASICYNDWWQICAFWNMTDMCTDDCWMGNTAQDQSGYYSIVHCTGVGQSNGVLANYWQYRYKSIVRCNIAIDNIPNTKVISEEMKTRLVAEARFLRAFFYFDLVKNFGAVPFIEHLLMPSQIEGITRTDAATLYAFMEKELKDVAEELPQRSAYTPENMGRATRGAALGFLGKIQLYQGKWSEAAATLKTVIDEKEYSLLPDFGQVWSVDHNNSAESLFEVQHKYDETYAMGGFFSMLCGSRSDPDDGWAWCLPSSNLEKAFKDAGDEERLKWTIIRHGATSIPGVSAASFKEKVGDSFPISPSIHKSARISRKVFIPFDKRPDVYSMGKLPLNHRLLRYADVLLMYAEAENMQGHDAEAREALNTVRRRVHLDDVTSGGDELKEAIRLERRLELALEQNRLYDIRRWDDANGKKRICNLMGKEGSFVKYNLSGADQWERENTGEPSDKGISFMDERDILFPIPLYEVTMSHGTITQNPYWN